MSKYHHGGTHTLELQVVDQGLLLLLADLHLLACWAARRCGSGGDSFLHFI
jgi:hypothetical protein